MTNTQRFAATELGVLIASTPDAIVRDYVPELLALCEKFCNSGQSGGSAPMTARALSQSLETLLLQNPLCPLTGLDEEWADVSEMNGNKPMFQNVRDSRVFKNGKDAQAVFIEAIVFDGDIGGRFTGNGSVSLRNEIIDSTQYIKSFPFTPKTFYVDVIDYRWKDKSETQRDVNGDWWTHSIANEGQLSEVFEYYNKK